MDFRNRTARLRFAGIWATVALLLTSTLAAAQSTTTTTATGPGMGTARLIHGPAFPLSSGPFVQVQMPNTELAGILTFYGVAVDCTTGAPASRVALFDGMPDADNYLADVTLGFGAGIEGACIGRSGPAPIGFTVMIDSRNLADGMHTLMFVAEYADGMAEITPAPVFLSNVLPYAPADNSAD